MLHFNDIIIIKDTMIQKFKKKVQNFIIYKETVLLVSTFMTCS